MTYQGVFDMALRLLSESSISGEVADYEDRAPALLYLCVSELRSLAADDTSLSPDAPVRDLHAPFPLGEGLIPCAAYYLAAMLVSEERPELSERLYAMYRERLPQNASSVSSVWSSHKIKSAYGF